MMSGSATTYVLLSVALAVSLLTMVVYKLIKKNFFDKLEEELSLGVNVPLLLESPTSLKKIPAPSLFDPRATKSLSVVIPAYNETIRLPSTLEETMTYLQRRRDRSGPNFTYEVIVVDDGSSDDTTGVAFEFVKKHGIDAVRVLSLPTNKGKGYAVKAGIMCTRGREVLFMDADGATAVSEIEKLEKSMNTMLQEMKADNEEVRTPPSWERGSRRAPPGIVPETTTTGGGDPLPPLFVLGSRAHLQNDAMAKRTAVRNVLMHGFHALVTLVVGNQIRDTQCGFKLMTRKAAQMIVPQQRLQRWAFDVELVKIAQTLQVPMKEEQVVWTEIPGSKVRLTSIAHIAFELALIKCGYDITKAWSVADTGRLAQQEKKKS
jgi:dolichyl-phosphate beta-glucosyltransferase